MQIQITGENIRIRELHEISCGGSQFTLSSASRQKMQESRNYIEKRIASGEVMYGVNTGFGAFSSVRISDSEIEELQRNLIRSHSVGVGEPFTIEQTRAMMFLRANTLARGHSGIRPEVVEKILEFLQNDVIPVIPSQGSVGASGDLAPLSHLALCLMGEGEAWKISSGTRPPVAGLSGSGGTYADKVSVQEVLAAKKMKPLVLKAKEGLSLINGCQVMTAIGMLAAFEAEELLRVGDIVGALSLEGLMGSRKAFHPLISAARPHAGEIKTARNLTKILGASSEIGESHRNCNRVQDAYSLRCMPAVHGAVKDCWNQVVNTLEIEANSSTDNPLVFAEADLILSCGNFHGMPVAFAMDYAGIAFTSFASISEQRIAKLINPAMSGLPAFLTPDGGLNSGHMIVQVAAASLVSENKVLAHPASVDTIPTSADKEDHVSMGTIAARKFRTILTNARNVLAMELLASTQALELVRPLKSTPALEAVHALVRERVPYAAKDRVFAGDIEFCSDLIRSGKISAAVQSVVGNLEI